MASKVKVLWKVGPYTNSGVFTGYRVDRYNPTWEVAICYVGNVYEAGSFEAAKIAAHAACNALNAVSEAEMPGVIATLKKMQSEMYAREREAQKTRNESYRKRA